MAMQLTIPPDLEALVQKRLDSGAFADAEDVLRRALEIHEESWPPEDRQALDQRIDRALAQVEAGKTYGQGEACRTLGAMRDAHLANLDRYYSLDPFQLTEDAILDIDAIWLLANERFLQRNRSRPLSWVYQYEAGAACAAARTVHSGATVLDHPCRPGPIQRSQRLWI